MREGLGRVRLLQQQFGHVQAEIDQVGVQLQRPPVILHRVLGGPHPLQDPTPPEEGQGCVGDLLDPAVQALEGRSVAEIPHVGAGKGFQYQRRFRVLVLDVGEEGRRYFIHLARLGAQEEEFQLGGFRRAALEFQAPVQMGLRSFQVAA